MVYSKLLSKSIRTSITDDVLFGVNKILSFEISNAPQMTSFPSEIFDQLPSLEHLWMENTGIELLPEMQNAEENGKFREKLELLAIVQSKLKSFSSDFLIFFSKLRLSLFK